MNTLSTSATTPLINRGWLVFTVMMLAILEVLDSTIINVALPTMMPSLGASQNQITWVLTSYVVASAIVLPISGFLTNAFGRRRFLSICAAGFMISSLLCGVSTSLPEIVAFRVLQGMFGASLIPISQTLLRETFPIEEQGKAMALWGIGILSAPIFGPTLGGFITEHTTWRWVFYINLPFCLIGLILIPLVIPIGKKIRQSIDVFSLFLLIAGVGSLQIMLDKGNELDWFASNTILILAVIAIFCIMLLIIRCIQQPNPLIQLQLYKDRNFALCSVLMLLFCGCIFSFVTFQPIMLESYFNYSAEQAGLLMAPLGIASAIGMQISSWLMYRIKIKYVLSIALLIASIGLWHQFHVTLQATATYFITSNVLIGFGMGLFFVPLSTYVFSTLDKQHIAEGSGLFSYARMFGTSIGISLIGTLASQLTQIAWHNLNSHVNIFNQNLTYWLQHQHLTTLNTTAVLRLSQTLAIHSSMLAFIDIFKLLAIVLLMQIPFALLLKSVKLNTKNH